MKLPPPVTSGVQSLGRMSTALPGKMYRAQAQAVQSFQNAMATFGDIGAKIYEQNAAAEHSKLRSEYMDSMNVAQAELEKEPYRQILDDRGKPTGELVSRHPEILNEYNITQKRIRDGILAKSTNNLAFRKLSEDLNQGEVAYRERTRTTAASWAVQDAKRGFNESFRTNIANNRFTAAEQDLVSATQVGAVSPAEQNRYASEILSKRQYRTGELLIDGIIEEQAKFDAEGNVTTGGKFNPPTLKKISELHRVFNEGEKFNMLMPAQIAALHSKLNYKVQDMMVEDVTFVAEQFSVEDADLAFQDYAGRRHDKSGFSDARAFESALGAMQAAINRRRVRNAKTQKEIGLDWRVLEILSGAPADPKLGDDKKAMDIVFDVRVAQEQAPEGSNKWIRIAGQQLQTQGWFPPKVESYVRANLLHGDPKSVATASKLVAYADRHAGRSLDWLDKKDIATALLINELTDAGVSDTDAFNKVREGIERLDEPTKNARTAAYNAEFSKHSYAVLEERVSAEDSFWTFGTAEIPQEMVERYDTLRRMNYQLTGNKNVADQMAYNEIKQQYGITKRSGDRILERKPPEAVLTDAPPEKVKEYVEDEYEQILEEFDLDRENISAIYMLDDAAENSWYLYDWEKGGVVTNPDGQMLKWQPSYADSRIGKVDKLKAEQARIQEEIEVERERLAYEAKMGRYETKPADLRFSDKMLQMKDTATDTMGKDIRKGTKAIDEFVTEDVPDFFSGTWNAVNSKPSSQEQAETLNNARMRNERYMRHERLKREVQAEPGSKMYNKIERLKIIEQSLEELE